MNGSLFSMLFSPSGRIGRGGWWLGQTIGLVFLLLATVILFAPMLGKPEAKPSLAGSLLLLAWIPLQFWMNLCVTIKRYHDRGKSGWWFLIVLVPFIGAIWQLIECGFASGEPEDNDYGPGPGMNIASDLAALGAPGKLASKEIDFSKYASSGKPATALAASSASTARPVFGKRA